METYIIKHIDDEMHKLMQGVMREDPSQGHDIAAKQGAYEALRKLRLFIVETRRRDMED